MLLGIADGHPERSGAKSKDPAEFLEGSITGSLDFAQDDVDDQALVFGRILTRSIIALLFYAPSIGTDPGFADIIIEQA